MKYLLALCLICNVGNAFAQHRYYCEVKGIEKDLSSGLKIIFDFGTKASYNIGGDLSGKLKFVDENGEEIKYTTYTHEFWKFKAVQILSNLSDDYQRYFSDNYLVKTPALDAALNVLKKANNQKIYKEINSALSYARSSLKALM